MASPYLQAAERLHALLPRLPVEKGADQPHHWCPRADDLRGEPPHRLGLDIAKNRKESLQKSTEKPQKHVKKVVKKVIPQDGCLNLQAESREHTVKQLSIGPLPSGQPGQPSVALESGSPKHELNGFEGALKRPKGWQNQVKHGFQWHLDAFRLEFLSGRALLEASSGCAGNSSGLRRSAMRTWGPSACSSFGCRRRRRFWDVFHALRG